MAQAAADRRTVPSEAELWANHLSVLRKAILMRKPDARDRIRSEVSRLEREIEAIRTRRNLAGRKQRHAEATALSGDAAAAEFAQLDHQMVQRLRRVSDLAALLRQNALPGKAQDLGGTPEAVLRPAVADPIEMLLGKGRLTEDQARAAREIAWVYQAMTKASRARVSRLCEIDPPAGWQEMPLPERAALVHAKCFLPWAEKLRHDRPATLDVVLQIVVMGLSVYAVARRHRLGWGRCVAELADGLDEYWRRGRG